MPQKLPNVVFLQHVFVPTLFPVGNRTLGPFEKPVIAMRGTADGALRVRVGI
jgi:hypothetical protein